MAFMTAEQEGRIATLLQQAEKWYDQNNIAEVEEDPTGDIMYDGFDYLITMIKIKKGIK